VLIFITEIIFIYLENLFSVHWKKAPTSQNSIPSARVFRISTDDEKFPAYYNEVQHILKAIAGMDEYLSGRIY